MKKILFVDDLRNPFLNIEGKAPKEDGVIHWVIDYQQFVQWITKFGLPDVISFDHDLGELPDGTEKSGKDCANWLVEYCLDHELPLPTYYVHSANTVGVQNIIGLLDNYAQHHKKFVATRVYTPMAVDVYEFERGWGKTLDDTKVCISLDVAKKFITLFNSKNDKKVVPDWYMVADSTPRPIELTENQLRYLEEMKGMVWLSQLKKIN